MRLMISSASKILLMVFAADKSFPHILLINDIFNKEGGYMFFYKIVDSIEDYIDHHAAIFMKA